MNKLSTERRTQLVASLVEGNSIRATARMTDTAFNTVLKFVVDIGTVCQAYLNETMVNVSSKRVQVDEIWQFCYAKDRNLPPAETPTRPRTRARIDADTSSCRPYLTAVHGAFHGEIDYAQLIKLYGKGDDEHRYSPPQCLGTRTEIRYGEPDAAHISTSYVERQNLTMRMSMRRFTRLTNGFSKKCENLAHAIALHYVNYNFVRVHKTLRCTPAMEAGLATRLWTYRDIAELLERAEARDAA